MLASVALLACQGVILGRNTMSCDLADVLTSIFGELKTLFPRLWVKFVFTLPSAGRSILPNSKSPPVIADDDTLSALRRVDVTASRE